MNLSQLVEQQKYKVNKSRNHKNIVVETDIRILKYLSSGPKQLFNNEAKHECQISDTGARHAAIRMKQNGHIQEHENNEYSITDLGRQLYECTKHLIE